MIYVMNSPVLTDYGEYRYYPIGPEFAAQLLRGKDFVSAVGHEAAAQFLTALLKVEIPFNRATIKMLPGDKAVVLRLLMRLPEGAVLSAENMTKIPYELGLLVRVK